MRIGCLGWGSLVWAPRELPLARPRKWNEDGPSLPVEFARASSHGRITLVIVSEDQVDPGLRRVPVLWTLLGVADLANAMTKLRRREGTSGQHIGFCTETESNRKMGYRAIQEWLLNRASQLDAVIWTALPCKPPGGLDGRKVSLNEVLSYLRDRDSAGQGAAAEEYVRRAPLQIRTAYREAIEQKLGWGPHP